MNHLFHKTNNKLIVIFLAIFITSNVNADEWSDSYRLETEGKFTAAASVIKPFTTQKPINEFALLRHGWLNYSARNYNDAIEDYQQALSLNPNSLDARLGLTLPLMAQGRWREAALHATKILKIAPWQYHAHIRLMACEEAMTQWDTMAKHATKVAERYPGDATIQVYLARASLSIGKPKIALVAYRRVKQMVPNHIESTRFLEVNDKKD